MNSEFQESQGAIIDCLKIWTAYKFTVHKEELQSEPNVANEQVLVEKWCNKDLILWMTEANHHQQVHCDNLHWKIIACAFWDKFFKILLLIKVIDFLFQGKSRRDYEKYPRRNSIVNFESTGNTWFRGCLKEIYKNKGS